MDCSKRSAPAVAGLPDDPLVEILYRVPAKSVCRFKCVSKAWRDLIDDPHNRKKLPQAMQGIFYSYTTYEKDCQPDGVEVNCFSFVDLRTARSVPPLIDPCFSFLTELPGIQFLDLLDSCNGLILFEHRRRRDYESGTLGYIVCNPTTKQWQDVPTCDHPHPRSTFTYLAFDPSVSPHFSLVQFEEDKDEEDEEFFLVRAYSSEMGTLSRSQIDQHGEQGQSEGWHYQVIRRSFDILQRAFVNGILHILVWDWGEFHRLILAVDEQGRTRRTITVPGATQYCYFGQSQGRLHFITRKALDCDHRSYEISIWVLQDYDTQEWVLKDSLSSLELFVDKSCGDNMADFIVVDIHQDCDVVFFALSRNNKLIAYDMGRKEVSVVATFEPKLVQKFARYFPCFSESPALTNKQWLCVLLV